MVFFSKSTALTLLGYFRQAERSVDYALSSPNQWPEFVAYYEARLTQIARLASILKATGAIEDEGLYRQPTAQTGALHILHCAVNAVRNRFKKKWSFSSQEVSFFLRTFDHLTQVAHKSSVTQSELIELRFDCFRCQYVIAHRLIGVPEIRAALSVEHFNQSQYIYHTKLPDIEEMIESSYTKNQH